MTSIVGTGQWAAEGLATSLVVPLDGVTRADVAHVGHKAANLGELRQAGLPVPDGVILTTRALEQFLASAGQPDAEALRQAPLPEPLARELFEAVARFGDQPLAVRSSSVAEDLPDRSYAGQYESVLDVRGKEAVARAVLACWSSAWSARAAAYRGAADHAADMAILLQPMVPAEAAGVAFSANPVTGARDQVVINAVCGLGERLVSGAASPDQWLVSADEAVAQATPERAIDADQARAIAELAREVERRFGCPQDIEWAIAGGQVSLLQARPITALPLVAVEPPPGYWEREASHSPRPFSPMCGPLQVRTVNAGFRAMFEEFGFLIETLEIREIGGWMYLRMVPIADQALLARRAARCVQAIRSQHHRELLERWEHEWRPRLAASLAGLWEVERSSLSDADLDEHFGAALDLFEEAIRIHFVLQGAIVLALGELAATCRDLLGWQDRETLELLNGLSATSTRPAVRLWELAQLAGGQRPDAEFGAAVKTFQQEFGKRALSLEFADPTLSEDPELLLRLIRDQSRAGNDPWLSSRKLADRRAAALASARAALRTSPLAAQERFERVLAVAQQAYPLREDNEPHTISGPTGLVRAVALEVGERLAQRSQLEQREDVFFLVADDARAALSDGRDRRSSVIGRRAERAWIEAHPGPASYGTPPGPPPPLDDLPPEIQLAMQALQWHAGHVFGFARHPGQAAAAPSATLSGIAASPGLYTGPARVVLTEADFGKIQPGDVLVCPATSPVWSVVFPQLGALVTDTGGLLSHPAIIAREYGIPAVVATGQATSVLADGDQLTVDGTAGVVNRRPISGG